MTFVENLIQQVPLNDVEPWMKSNGLSPSEQTILAIMLDQMPRNALAIGFGRYSNVSNTNVKSLITESFSRKFSEIVMENFDLSQITDERIICFFSLIFRHANDFARARSVLTGLRDTEGNLPPLALKFWRETDKRETSLSNNAHS